MFTLNVGLDQRSYPVYIGANLSNTDLLKRHIKGSQIAVVTNTTVAPLYLETLLSGLPNHCEIVTIELPDGERYKTLDTLSTLFDQLLEAKQNRTTTLIALGGGVVGDITGFAAATYLRGVRFLQIPTTLLAQVDSSVGGKTGVNHPMGKNMIGAFYQPHCVLADMTTLRTLPDREFSAGLAEVIKYGLIADAPFLVWLEEHMHRLLQRDLDALSYAVQCSCENKARIVAEDEQEVSGVRALLNFGHTFGHAIERLQGYGAWLHGEAVAAGMMMAADLSARLGYIRAQEVTRLKHLLEAAALPTQPPQGLTPSYFLEAMSVDKKVLNRTLHLILLKGIGNAWMTADVPDEALKATLEHMLV